MEQKKISEGGLVVVGCQIPIKLPSLNDYINACRRNKYAGAKFKKDIEEELCWYFKRLPKINEKVFVEFYWTEENKKRDPDNIASAKKFVFDALVKSGVLPNDNWNYIGGFQDYFEVGEKAGLRIVITKHNEDKTWREQYVKESR